MTAKGRQLAALVAGSGLAVSMTILGPVWAETGVTFDAPGAGSHASITVTKTTGLGNETVGVSWRGFEPSSADQLQNGGGSFDTNTTNPVRVYQCRGAGPSNPRDARDCYGSSGFRGIPATDGSAEVSAVPGYTYDGQVDRYQNLPDGPANFQDTVTTDNGSGQVTIQIFTKRESPSLGCDQNTPCSLVVVPNYGRPNGATEDQLDAPWAWERRTVIPLSFAGADPPCSGNAVTATVEGSPLSARALASWRAASCVQPSNPVGINYTMLDETQARGDAGSGATDIGLSIRPIPAKTKTDHPITYAPVAVGAIALAFQIDDGKGQPVPSMRLNQRLVAKLITASYRIADDPNVAGNPKNLFRDPEFLALNPGVDWPSGAPGNHPLLLAELSDMTWTLTRWITADPQARAFLNGQPDPYGMHVNKAYQGLEMPVERFPVLDQAQSNDFEPIQGLDHVAQSLSLAQFPGAISSVEDGLTIVTKPPRQNPGRREVIGIVDAAEAAAFRLQTADLTNSAGEFVGPTPTGLAAGVKSMTANPDKITRDVDLTAKDPQIYPLTVVVNALVPLDAKGSNKQAIVRFLDYTAAEGQISGSAPGDLPPGYQPLPKVLLDLNRVARAAVVKGVTAPSAATSKPGASSTGSSASGATSSDGRTAAAAQPAAAAPATAVAATEVAGGERGRLGPLDDPAVLAWLLPALVVLTLLALVAGPVLLFLSGRGGIRSWRRR